MNEIHYYAQIDDDGICMGVSQLSGVVDKSNMIELESYDTSLLGKLWTGAEWMENPKPPEPPEPSAEPTTQDHGQAQRHERRSGERCNTR